MPIFDNPRLVFIHIPKTAGTSLRVTLEKNFGTGRRAGERTHHLLKEMTYDKDYRAFCVVRDPITRAKSFYRWFRTHQSDLLNYPYKALASKYNFEDWLNKWLIPDDPAQSNYFLIDGKVPDNVAILRFEYLIEDLDNYLNKQLNLNIELNDFPHMLRIDKQEDFTCSDKTIKLVRQKEKWLYENKYY